MEIDDVAEKMRRNTLVLSVVTLIFNYLGLEFPDTFLGLKLTYVDDVKIWSVVAIGSLYFFCRYVYSDEAVKLREVLSGEKRAYQVLARAVFVRHFFSFYKFGIRLPKRFADDLDGVLNDLAGRIRGIDRDSIRVALVRPDEYDVEKGTSSPENLGIYLHFKTIDGNVGSRDVIGRFVWPKWVLFFAKCYVNIRILTNLNLLINILMPYVLFGFAMVSLVVRVLWSLLGPKFGVSGLVF